VCLLTPKKPVDGLVFMPGSKRAYVSANESGFKGINFVTKKNVIGQLERGQNGVNQRIIVI
jgi:hypothetical protein